MDFGSFVAEVKGQRAKSGSVNMEWHGDKLLPYGLPNLIYQVTPPRIASHCKFIAHPRLDVPGCEGRAGHVSGRPIVHIYPTVILKYSKPLHRLAAYRSTEDESFESV